MIFYFLAPFLISIALIPFLLYFSKKNNIFDFPEEDILKIHKAPVSIFGGFAMFLSAFAVFLFLSFWETKFLYIISACLVVFLLGFWDDFNWKHISKRKPYLKFFFLIFCSLIAGLALYFAGIKFYVFPFLVAPLYIFVLINAVNYQDGMDGHAGFLTLLISATLQIFFVAIGILAYIYV